MAKTRADGRRAHVSTALSACSLRHILVGGAAVAALGPVGGVGNVRTRLQLPTTVTCRTDYRHLPDLRSSKSVCVLSGLAQHGLKDQLCLRVQNVRWRHRGYPADNNDEPQRPRLAKSFDVPWLAAQHDGVHDSDFEFRCDRCGSAPKNNAEPTLHV